MMAISEREMSSRLGYEELVARFNSVSMDVARLREMMGLIDVELELAPLDARLHSLRGWARTVAGDGRDAIADFDRAIELDGRHGAYYYNRGLAYEMLGESDLAQESFVACARLAVESGDGNLLDAVANHISVDALK
ncbi:tetratricopeptide repeat protein [Corallococcus exercitus]|uniref:Tetratricopeptide repeat protein n=1 Tax=Corallococcus exercitus TaxID=2316736 RepID=A0A7Y4KMQ0_9BACT|nr:tetratricopeptide repeat protein [Corallococcus exercitus]NOK36586.1 hypothetical protein [Corallococcus exercitus]